ncbi:hypothetical protein EON65_51010 [archaeon]|nr:MAG: hypothetical protein EON65_51010 [archaeon]
MRWRVGGADFAVVDGPADGFSQKGALSPRVMGETRAARRSFVPLGNETSKALGSWEKILLHSEKH